MQDAIVMELDTNLSFKAKIDTTPAAKQSFATVYLSLIHI